MRKLRMGAVSLILAGAVRGNSPDPKPQRPVTVCMNPGGNGPIVFRAEAAAGQILATAGVKVIWRGDVRACAEPVSGIVITLKLNTAAEFHPGAMAYAMPFEHTTIIVFYDRVQAANLQPLLAHVLVGCP